MDLLSLDGQLDGELKIPTHSESLVEWAATETNRPLINPEFLDRKTGLLLRGSTQVERVYTSVFASDMIVKKLLYRRDCFLFTHHHFNYHKDSRGLSAIEPEALQMLTERGTSILVGHAPLDTHPRFGTSVALAKLLGVSVDGSFYDYFGAPTAMYGHIPKTSLKSFSDSVRIKLSRPMITLVGYNPFIEKVAVVAGGGDLPDLLHMAFDLGCDTLVTGTVEHRWQLPSIQDVNRAFHKLNEELELNLIGGTYFGTERPAMIEATKLFNDLDVASEYLEDDELLCAQ